MRVNSFLILASSPTLHVNAIEFLTPDVDETLARISIKRLVWALQCPLPFPIGSVKLLIVEGTIDDSSPLAVHDEWQLVTQRWVVGDFTQRATSE